MKFIATASPVGTVASRCYYLASLCKKPLTLVLALPECRAHYLGHHGSYLDVFNMPIWKVD